MEDTRQARQRGRAVMETMPGYYLRCDASALRDDLDVIRSRLQDVHQRGVAAGVDPDGLAGLTR